MPGPCAGPSRKPCRKRQCGQSAQACRAALANSPPRAGSGTLQGRSCPACIGGAPYRRISPIALSLAYIDWAWHLAAAPQRQLQISDDAWRSAGQLFEKAAQGFGPDQGSWSLIKPKPQDRRFADPQWERPPFNMLAQTFLLSERWWHNATTGVRGVAPANEAVVEFSVRQLLDMLSPSNFAATNPEVLQKAFQSGGENLVLGWQNWYRDWLKLRSPAAPSRDAEFVVGETVATSPGKVVFRNELIELIQYAPTTDKVRPEPILIVPAWIMKYYILDLSPDNSLVKYLTGEGFTVFMVSWRNPTAADRDIAFDDYRTLGVNAAVATIGVIMPGRRFTRWAIVSAAPCSRSRRPPWCAMATTGLKTVTLLAAQTDFTEAGELTLFINESQVTFLEDMMWEQGVSTPRKWPAPSSCCARTT